jgi:hypothetical protein
MKPIQIIRVEHEDGYGMFRKNSDRYRVVDLCESVMGELCERHREFPTPNQDNLIEYKDGYEWFCAFRSMEEFNSWVTREQVSVLIEYDFRVFILEVTEYQIGDYQVLYRKDSIISKTDITNLY